MSNRNLISVKTSIFRNKLAKILNQLQKDKDKFPQQTKEALVAEAVKLLAVFYRTIDRAQFQPTKIIPGTKPDLDDYNAGFNQVKDDIDILFAELENLESVILEQFNLFATQANRINSRIKKLTSRVTDFTLYSKLPIKNAVFFSDSFTDTSKIDTGSNLLNTTECDINQAEGIITLPIDQSKTTSLNITLTPTINSNSNGRSGNNEELGINQLNNNISVILDNNPDTWFEYERVVQEDDGVPLLLDLTLNLNTEEIVNYIRINPNNFGTKTEIEILDISTSTDGQVYTSIKDELINDNILFSNENNVFNLAPSTSKYAGQGIFTITPRYAKYIKVTLRQITPYIIGTVQGEQFRYAIGLRDIEVKRIAFLATGEVISNSFNTEQEIKKVALRVAQIPKSDSELAEIKHQLSLDDGSSWVNIQPLENNGVLNLNNENKEILNINNEDSGAITTNNAVKGLRYKAILARKDSNFNESSSTFAEEVAPFTELKPIPLSDPWSFSLSKKPLVASISVLDTSFGSRGNKASYILGKGTNNAISFELPWSNLNLDYIKDENNKHMLQSIARVFVGGEEWSQVGDFSTSQANSKVFILKFVETKLVLQFGDGFRGKAPESDQLIGITFTDERLYPTQKSKHYSTIEFPTSIDKAEVSIYRKNLIVQNTIELSKETNIHRLPHRNIIQNDTYPIKFTNSDGVFDLEKQKDFQNGLASPNGELTENGDWSIDTTRGIVFSYLRTDSTPGTITYFYQDQIELSSQEWDWGDNFPIHNSIVIKDSAWVPNKVVGQTVASGLKILHLPHLSLVEGSVHFTNTSSLDSDDNPFIKEVEYIDGTAELTTAIKTEELIPVLTGSSVVSFTTSTKIHSSTALGISFSNTSLFNSLQNSQGAVNGPGKYFVNISTSTVYVYIGNETVSNPGKIVYYTSDPSKIETGSYSIDYKLGIIYLQRPVPTDTITLNYEYSEYYIRYNIAREVTDWEFDPTNNTIIIGPNEINKRGRIPSITGINNYSSNYQINYQYISKIRKNIDQLKDFFSPILKDYILQVVTSDLL